MALWLITVALCFSAVLQPRGKGWIFFPLNAAVEMCRVVSKPAKRRKNSARRRFGNEKKERFTLYAEY